jgi:hypothetical protein
MRFGKTSLFLSLIALGACVPSDNAQDNVSAAATAGEACVVYGQVTLQAVGSRQRQALVNEPMELKVASVVLGNDGQPVAYANGIPFKSCVGAQAIAQTTTDDSGRYEWKGVAAGDYCVTTRGKEIVFHVDESDYQKGLDTLNIDPNAYGSVCLLDNPPPAGVSNTCFDTRNFVGAKCHCQTSLSSFDSGTIQPDR